MDKDIREKLEAEFERSLRELEAASSEERAQHRDLIQESSSLLEAKRRRREILEVASRVLAGMYKNGPGETGHLPHDIEWAIVVSESLISAVDWHLEGDGGS